MVAAGLAHHRYLRTTSSFVLAILPFVPSRQGTRLWSSSWHGHSRGHLSTALEICAAHQKARIPRHAAAIKVKRLETQVLFVSPVCSTGRSARATRWSTKEAGTSLGLSPCQSRSRLEKVVRWAGSGFTKNPRSPQHRETERRVATC
jgi:hypothetical protein